VGWARHHWHGQFAATNQALWSSFQGHLLKTFFIRFEMKEAWMKSEFLSEDVMTAAYPVRWTR